MAILQKVETAPAKGALGKLLLPGKDGKGDLYPVVELACTTEGNWKKLSDGTVVKLSYKQWREELKKAIASA